MKTLKFKIGDKVKFNPKKASSANGIYITREARNNDYEYTTEKFGIINYGGSGTKDGFDWKVKWDEGTINFFEDELIGEIPEVPFLVPYEEPLEEEFTDNCVATCKPGQHACGK